MSLDTTLRSELLALARQSIERSLTDPHQALIPFARANTAPPLLQPHSTFVTLRIGKELRGCCGTLEATRPLDEDVWRNAWASAFCDSRFPPLQAREWPGVHLHIAVLGAPEPIHIVDERDLLQQLRPGSDGLILELGSTRVTFLPAVWEQLPEPENFLEHLKHKAGWTTRFWSPRIRAYRYGSEDFGEP
jgi:AmmeMemoRadiSam system protein A